MAVDKKQPRQDSQHLCLIIDDENLFLLHQRPPYRCMAWYRILCRMSSYRQFDNKGGSTPWLTFHAHRAPMTADDALPEREPQAGALSRGLGGEKGLKNAWLYLSWNARPCIGHHQDDAL